MGKLGGDELNYSSDIDLIFVYGDDGETAGGADGRRGQRRILHARRAGTSWPLLEEVTDEGYAFRVDLRLRPEGRMGALVLSLDGYRAYFADRAALWERQALIKARVVGRRRRASARASRAWPARSSIAPGVDPAVVAGHPRP